MIKKLIKYTVSAAVLATMIQATPAFANPVTQGQIDATQGQINDFETKMQQLDNRITLAMENSAKLNNQISEQQGKIEGTRAEIEAAKKSLESHKEVYSERLKSIQLEGKISIATYAELLLSSTNLSEFLNRFTAISQIMEQDTDLLNGLNEKEQALKTAEQKLNSELDNLKKSQDKLAAEQKSIEEDKKEVATAIAAAKDKLQNLEDQQAQEEAERQAQIAAQQAAQQATQQAQKEQTEGTQQQSTVKSAAVSLPTNNVAIPTNSGSASAVIAYAKQFLGVPYVWGGTTPNGFDCSGFVSYVYRSVGVGLPRVSRDQQNVGTRISPSQVQPGDLVFRGSPAYHVGIYIGGGQYIHAPQTGDVVKIASYNPSSFSSAARILH
ncbi:C40 family peptidase [Neobacillus sp. MM2021_6]|uniref:C40 family peptidase n=1 Tax=Bacillaceae TaxID=186817 RepID=UPI001A94DCD7|nr:MULTISPECIES: NlpC/P60 family protein [Bacillaceae]MBO0962616.1 C40 family peptidase [Neobacillus sp. MM2021_6]